MGGFQGARGGRGGRGVGKVRGGGNRKSHFPKSGEKIDPEISDKKYSPNELSLLTRDDKNKVFKLIKHKNTIGGNFNRLKQLKGRISTGE